LVKKGASEHYNERRHSQQTIESINKQDREREREKREKEKKKKKKRIVEVILKLLRAFLRAAVLAKIKGRKCCAIGQNDETQSYTQQKQSLHLKQKLKI